MKKLIYLSSLFLIFTFTSTIAQELPKDGAVISMKETNLEIAKGTQHEAIVELIRSKRYRKAGFGGLTANSPQGLDIKFVQNPENKDLYTMTVDAAIDAETKMYTVIIKGEGKNSHKVKGIAISINVGTNQIVNN
ncbi:MAG TPA: hypothetical protein PKL31_00365 [Fulvivirga sp.]|nr:hypothetical protein [Fulvivirga sp.]